MKRSVFDDWDDDSAWTAYDTKVKASGPAVSVGAAAAASSQTHHPPRVIRLATEVQGSTSEGSDDQPQAGDRSDWVAVLADGPKACTAQVTEGLQARDRVRLKNLEGFPSLEGLAPRVRHSYNAYHTESKQDVSVLHAYACRAIAAYWRVELPTDNVDVRISCAQAFCEVEVKTGYHDTQAYLAARPASSRVIVFDCLNLTSSDPILGPFIDEVRERTAEESARRKCAVQSPLCAYRSVALRPPHGGNGLGSGVEMHLTPLAKVERVPQSTQPDPAADWAWAETRSSARGERPIPDAAPPAAGTIRAVHRLQMGHVGSIIAKVAELRRTAADQGAHDAAGAIAQTLSALLFVGTLAQYRPHRKGPLDVSGVSEGLVAQANSVDAVLALVQRFNVQPTMPVKGAKIAETLTTDWSGTKNVVLEQPYSPMGGAPSCPTSMVNAFLAAPIYPETRPAPVEVKVIPRSSALAKWDTASRGDRGSVIDKMMKPAPVRPQGSDYSTTSCDGDFRQAVANLAAGSPSVDHYMACAISQFTDLPPPGAGSQAAADWDREDVKWSGITRLKFDRKEINEAEADGSKAGADLEPLKLESVSERASRVYRRAGHLCPAGSRNASQAAAACLGYWKTHPSAGVRYPMPTAADWEALEKELASKGRGLSSNLDPVAAALEQVLASVRHWNSALAKWRTRLWGVLSTRADSHATFVHGPNFVCMRLPDGYNGSAPRVGPDGRRTKTSMTGCRYKMLVCVGATNRDAAAPAGWQKAVSPCGYVLYWNLYQSQFFEIVSQVQRPMRDRDAVEIVDQEGTGLTPTGAMILKIMACTENRTMQYVSDAVGYCFRGAGGCGRITDLIADTLDGDACKHPAAVLALTLGLCVAAHTRPRATAMQMAMGLAKVAGTTKMSNDVHNGRATYSAVVGQMASSYSAQESAEIDLADTAWTKSAVLTPAVPTPQAVDDSTPSSMSRASSYTTSDAD